MTTASHSGARPAPDHPFWLSACSYWQPAHFPVTAWEEHAPFAFWLFDALRPSTVVELGTHAGFSCFVFAEAAARLGTDVRIDAVDSWQGDDHAGFYGEDVHDAVAAIVARDYPDSVRMLRGYFSETRPLIEDASVDLLHIDGRHAYEDVAEDYEQWRSAVRDGGVILFHDIVERERGFGVWRLWDKLASGHPSFEFHHGHGLGVLAVGEPRTAALGELFAADEATAARVRADYERLGAGVAEGKRLRALPAEVASLRAEVLRYAESVRNRQAAVAERDRQISDLSGLVSEQFAEISRSRERIAALEASTSWRVTAPLRSLGRMRHPRS